jgi:hypothetical protein
MLVSPAILHLQNTLQNLACCFIESNPAITFQQKHPVEKSFSAKPPDFCM